MPSLATVTGKLGKKKAAHLLRRATFGATKKEIDNFAELNPDQAFTLLFKSEPPPMPPIDPLTGKTWVHSKREENNSGNEELHIYFKGWWLDQMRKGGTSCTEKMTYFLHTHFTTIQSVVENSNYLYFQNALFRRYALGNFKLLSKKICLDNAMLVFLDSRLNESGRPNENYAREFLELYSIGKGLQRGPDDYTNFKEQDVQEASRILSGYKNDLDLKTFDPETGLASGFLKVNSEKLAERHDSGAKKFSAAFNFKEIIPEEVVNGLATEAAALKELDDFLDMIYEQEETAKHICRKIYRFFVYYNITEQIEQDIIVPLASIFRAENYELAPVLKALFRSQHFYDFDNNIAEDDNHGAIIKSPVELMIGTLRFFKITLPEQGSAQFNDMTAPALLKYLEEQGLDLYEPYEVAGYDAYHQEPHFNRSWISSNFLARRYEFANHIISNNSMGLQGFYLDILEYIKDPECISDPSDAIVLVQELIDYLLPEEISEERFNYFLKDLLLDNLSTINWKKEWENYLQTGDGTAVRIQLESLILALLQSPEYQLC